MSEGERCWDITPVVAREKLRQPKVKCCGVTRLASDYRLLLTQTGEHDFHTAGRRPLDRQRFDDANDLSGLVEPIATTKEPDPIATLVLPAGLCQRDRLGPWQTCVQNSR